MKQTFLFLILLTLQKEPRQYKLSVPETHINSLWNFLHGNTENVSVAQYKELMVMLETQILIQAKEFKLQDSLKLKK